MTDESVILERSERVRELATALTERLQSFETWLGELRGRVCVEIPGPPSLKVMRDGRSWIVAYKLEDGTFKPLLQGGLVIKMAAVKVLPELLDAMLQYQGVMIEDLDLAIRQFDAMWALQMSESRGNV